MDAEKLPSNPGRTLAVQEPPVKFRFGPEFKKKWGFIPNLDGIDKMFRNQRRLGNSPDADYHHMLVFGPPGCGKTTFVNELMAVYERDPSKVHSLSN
jgi:Cdc6-like AAA superfamily ATPase